MAFRQFRFKEETDVLLLKETLTVNPFQFTNGMGWQLMISNLTENYDVFPVTITGRTLRDRLNLLLDKYAIQRKDKEGSEKWSEKDRLLEQVFQLRESVIQETLLKGTSDVSSKKEPLVIFKEQGQPSLTVLSEDIGNEVDRKEVLTFTVINNDPTSGEHHEQTNGGSEDPHSQCKAKKCTDSLTRNENQWLAFLAEREERYLKLREQELEVRRLELETQQKRDEYEREEKEKMKAMQHEKDEKDREERSRILELLVAALQSKT